MGLECFELNYFLGVEHGGVPPVARQTDPSKVANLMECEKHGCVGQTTVNQINYDKQ